MSHICIKHGFLFMGIVTGVISVSCLCWLHCVFDRFRLTAIKRNFQRDQEIMIKKKSPIIFFGCWLLVVGIFLSPTPYFFSIFWRACFEMSSHRTLARCVADFVGLDKCVWDEIPAVATIFVFFFF